MVHLQHFEVALTSQRQFLTQDHIEEQKEKVLQAERVLLHTLGFDFNVSHPYKPLLSLAKHVNQLEQVLEGQSRSLTQVAWNFANDRYELIFSFLTNPTSRSACLHLPKHWTCAKTSKSLRTTLCLQYPAQDIAHAVMYLGTDSECRWVFSAHLVFCF